MNVRRVVGVVGVSLVTVVLAGCDWMPGKPTEAERPVVPDQVMDFAALYGHQCAGCHGADGKFGAALPLNDPLYLALVGRETLRTTISTGVPGTFMPGFAKSAGGGLTDKQIDTLIDEMLTRWGDPHKFSDTRFPAYSLTDAGDPERGSRAYATYCAHCHGTDGSGGPNGGSVVDGSYLALVSDQALRTVIIVGRADLGMPDWRDDVAGQPMSGQEITDVVAWLASQRVPFPGAPYAQQHAKDNP